MTRRGQALLETAICLPVLLILALGASAAIRVADARAGLDAACAAAVATAARAPTQSTAAIASEARFRSVAAGYPLRNPTLSVSLAGFDRGATVTADAGATVDLSFAPVPGWASPLRITSSASARIDDWRSRQ